jgi:hypothetical protein
MSEKLLCCPFCGGIPEVGKSIHGFYLSHKPSDMKPKRRCVLPNFVYDYGDEESAIAAWNRRAATPSPAVSEEMRDDKLRALAEKWTNKDRPPSLMSYARERCAEELLAALGDG